MSLRRPTRSSKILETSATPPPIPPHAPINSTIPTMKTTRSLLSKTTLLPATTTHFPPNPSKRKLPRSPLLEIFADKKMIKSLYSKNMDIYQVPSIKKNTLLPNTKSQNKTNSSMPTTTSTLASIIFLKRTNNITPIGSLQVSKSQGRVYTERSSIQRERRKSRNREEAWPKLALKLRTSSQR